MSVKSTPHTTNSLFNDSGEKNTQGEHETPVPISANVVDKGFLDGLRDLKNAGRYEIRHEIGRGSAGVVYLGWDPLIKRQVALKISKPSSESARKTFFLEAQSAGMLNHPNIMAIYDINLHQEYCYLVIEYIEGLPLSQYCTPNNLLPLHGVADIIDSACRALDYAHNEGVVHKDIKPSNIMLDKVGAVKITDFSIAQIVGAEYLDNTLTTGDPTTGHTYTHHPVLIVGTPSYMSPEQLNERIVSPKSDIFSLGCVLYELLTGVKAFRGETLMSTAYQILHENPIPVSELNKDLPKELDEIVQKALAKKPADRYMTCRDLASSFKAVVRNIRNDACEAGDFFDFVHSVSFFNAFTKPQVRELVTTSNIVRMSKGKVIIEEGQTDDVFYILLSGKVQIEKGERILATLGPGECFGEMAYLVGQPRSATAIALTSCTLMKMKVAALHKSSEAVQMLFYRRFAKTLAARLDSSQLAY